MPQRSRTLWVLALTLGLLLPAVAGCIGEGDEANEATGPSEDPPTEDPAKGPDASSETVRTMASATGTVSFLGLAIYDGVERERVEPLVPDDMTPTGCFLPDAPGTVDVTLIAAQRTYDGVPDGGEPVGQVALVGCAERPEGLTREASNEVPWVGLMDWIDNEPFGRFLASMGLDSSLSSTTFEEGPAGYSVSVEADGTAIVEAHFLPSPTGEPLFFRCEPETFNGRSIVERSDGSLAALDWNKTEAVCPAEAEITWPSQSPLADVLGDARTPTFVIDTRVEEATYWWRALPEPGAGG